MAEEKDQSQKTEEPSPKRLQEARNKGDVANSREVANWFMLTAGTLAVAFLLPRAATDIRQHLTRFVAMPHTLRVEPDMLRLLLLETASDIGKALALTILLFVVAAVASSLSQTGLLFSPERLKPDLGKLSPIKGAKRLFSIRSVAELGKGLLKIGLIGGLAFTLIRPVFPLLPIVPASGLPAAIDLLYATVLKVLVGAVAVVSLIAIADVMLTRHEHIKKLRMTKEEVKDEHRQSEGDPHVKARLRAIRTERARQRIMQAVPTADVVVTNPTHYAVALGYDAATMAAPRVVAKGADLLAQRIRQVAEENDVPLVENPPLARALHDGVEVGQDVKPEHYKAVAEVIAFVMRGKTARVAPAPAT